MIPSPIDAWPRKLFSRFDMDETHVSTPNENRLREFIREHNLIILNESKYAPRSMRRKVYHIPAQIELTLKRNQHIFRVPQDKKNFVVRPPGFEPGLSALPEGIHGGLKSYQAGLRRQTSTAACLVRPQRSEDERNPPVNKAFQARAFLSRRENENSVDSNSTCIKYLTHQ